MNLREVGRLRVLQSLHDTGQASRPELVRLTGLSRATVASLVSDLMSIGLVRENEAPAVARRTGRPAQSLSLLPSAAHAIGVDIGHEHVRVMVCDLFGVPLWQRLVDTEVDRAPEETLALVVELVDEALRADGVARRRVLGLGVGIAAPVDKTTGTLGSEGIMPGWRGMRPAAELERRTGLTTRITNDANAGALAERLYGAARDRENMVYVRLSAGIGAGVVADGRLLLGASGLVGELGHLPVVTPGRVCRCGNRGCLETVASPVAIAALLRENRNQPIGPGDLPRLLAERDRGALRAVADAAAAVGAALATLVTLLNPELIVVGGDLAAAGDTVVAPIRESVRRYALPSAAAEVTVVSGELGRQAEVRGAAGVILAEAPRRLVAMAGAAASDRGEH